MNPKSYIANVYYLFMSVLPLVCYPKLMDNITLPRQLFVTIFVSIIIGFILLNLKRTTYSLTSLHIAVIVYVIIASIASVTQALTLSISYYVLSKQLLLFLYFFSTVYLLKNELITIKQVVTAVVLFAIVSISTGLYDITKTTLTYHQLYKHWGMVTGGFGNKNILAAILFFCIPFLLIRLSNNKITYLLKIIAVGLALFVISIVNTRAVILATGVFTLVVVYYIFKERIKKHFIWFGSAFVGLVVFCTYSIYNSKYFGTGKFSTDISVEYFYRLFDSGTFKIRLILWKESITMFLEHPFLGVGLGNWTLHHSKYGLTGFPDWNTLNGVTIIQQPHNDFLCVLSETGPLGFVALYTFFGIIIYQLHKKIKAEKKVQTKNNLIIIYAGIIGYFVVSFFDFPSERIPHQLVFMTLLALAYVYGSETTETNKVPFYLPKITLVFSTLAILLFSFFITIVRVNSEQHVALLKNAKESGDVTTSMLHAKQASSHFYEMDYHSVPIDWYIGTLHFQQGNIPLSISYFEKAHAISPYNIKNLHSLAVGYEKMGNPQRAILLLQKALVLSPNFEDALVQLAVVYFNQKQYKKAFEIINKIPVSTKNTLYNKFIIPIIQGNAYFDPNLLDSI